MKCTYSSFVKLDLDGNEIWFNDVNSSTEVILFTDYIVVQASQSRVINGNHDKYLPLMNSSRRINNIGNG